MVYSYGKIIYGFNQLKFENRIEVRGTAAQAPLSRQMSRLKWKRWPSR